MLMENSCCHCLYRAATNQYIHCRHHKNMHYSVRWELPLCRKRHNSRRRLLRFVTNECVEPVSMHSRMCLSYMLLLCWLADSNCRMLMLCDCNVFQRNLNNMPFRRLSLYLPLDSNCRNLIGCDHTASLRMMYSKYNHFPLQIRSTIHWDGYKQNFANNRQSRWSVHRHVRPHCRN